MRPIPSDPCLALIRAFEKGPGGSFAATRYQDPSGFWTIGWGHRTGMNDPWYNATITQGQADNIALQDLTAAATGVSNTLASVLDTLSDNQYAACIDFTFNLGVGAFAGSTLAHFINVGAMHLVPAEFNKWVYEKVGGVETKMPGIVKRRAAEVQVWLL